MSDRRNCLVREPDRRSRPGRSRWWRKQPDQVKMGYMSPLSSPESSGDEDTYESPRFKRWSSLTDGERAAAKEFGLTTAKHWRGRFEAATHGSEEHPTAIGNRWLKSWGSLAEHQRHAAGVLGYDREAWQTEVINEHNMLRYSDAEAVALVFKEQEEAEARRKAGFKKYLQEKRRREEEEREQRVAARRREEEERRAYWARRHVQFMSGKVSECGCVECQDREEHGRPKSAYEVCECRTCITEREEAAEVRWVMRSMLYSLEEVESDKDDIKAGICSLCWPRHKMDSRRSASCYIRSEEEVNAELFRKYGRHWKTYAQSECPWLLHDFDAFGRRRN